MELSPLENPLSYKKGHTSSSGHSNPLKVIENPSAKLKMSLKLDLKPRPITKKLSPVERANQDRMQTIHAFGDNFQSQNPELVKKAKLMHNRLTLNDNLQTVEFHKALKDETLKILNQQRGGKGTMYVKDLWGKNYYSSVVKKSGIGKVLGDMKRMHWQSQDKVLDILDHKYRDKHKNDDEDRYMSFLVEKYRQKYGNSQSFGTPGNRSISESRRNSLHLPQHQPPHHQHSNSQRDHSHSKFYSESTATKSHGPSKLKLPNIHDKSGSDYYMGSPDSHIHDHGVQSARHLNYDKIQQIATGGDYHHHHHHHQQHHHPHHHIHQNHQHHDHNTVPNWMEDSISNPGSDSSRNYFHENDIFWAEIEDINYQCNSARESSKDLKKKIEFLEKFMHLSLAKDRTIKISFAHKMKADTIKDFQSLLKHSEKYEDIKLQEIKNNFQKRRDEIIKQSLENPHKHIKPVITKKTRPEFRFNAK